VLRLISHSWRSWKNAKGVAVLSVLALAIGIGSATAIFSIVNGVLLKPLPYSHSDRWVALFGGSTLGSEADRYSALSIADLIDYQQRNHSFDVFGYYNITSDFNLSSRSLVEHVNGAEITPSLLNNVGVNPVLGHLFQESDGRRVAMLSERLWRRLGSGSAVIGSSITLNGQSYSVAGVMPAWFQLPIVNVSTANVHNDVWIPVNPPTDPAQRRDSAYYAGYARLKMGVTLAQARDDAQRVAAEIVKENPGRSVTYTATLFGLQEFVAKEIRPYLLLFLGAAALLLLVTCANVAGLLVARSVGRAHEIAVRIALGANKTDLALQFVLEGCVISIAAGALGLIASVGLTRLIVSFASEYIPRAEEVSTDGLVVLFVAGVACLTAVLPALPPLWQALRTQPHEILSNGVRASAGARGRRLSRSLVVGEVAFAFLMLSVSGLLISELEKLRHTSPGFDASHLLAFQLNATGEKYSSTKEFLAHQDQLLTALEVLPGVRGAALANQLPLDGCCFSTSLYPESQLQKEDFAESVSIVIVSPGYFKTMGIPLLKGRLLTQKDTNDNPVPIVIDEAAAKRYWPKQDAVGAFARQGGVDGARAQVVGVVGNVRNQGLGDATIPEVYLLNAQAPVTQMQFIVRSDLPPVSLVPAVRHAVQTVDPERAIYGVRTMDRVAGDSLTPQRLDSIVSTFFALAAFLMASLGIYGVMSYSVRERTVEIGTRMALGAVRGDLLSLIVGDGFKMAAQGMLIGIPAAFGVTMFLLHFLHLHEIGVLPYASSAGLVGSVATFASVFPAWRATLVSPMVAIRNESESLWAVGWRSVKQIAEPEHVQNEVSPSASTLSAGLVDASRRAESFSEALTIALSNLRENLRTESAMLFERVKANDPVYRCRAASPAASSEATIPADGILAGRLNFHSSPLGFASDEMDTVLRWARERKPQHAAEVEHLKEIGLRLAVPLQAKDEISGILLLGPPLGRNQYSSADKDIMQIYAQQLALMIENARLTERALEHEKIRQDVALAAEVQDRLLPQKSIETEAITVAAFSLPARGIGGDCYDFLDLADNGVGIALADVAGKGVAAALIMAAVQASLRIIAAEGLITPAQIAAKLNSFLHRSTRSESYATFFYAQFDAKARQLHYVNAGHNPPFFVHSSAASPGVIEELKAGGTIVGMFPDSEYQEQRIDIRPGDLLLAFTDGVTDAMNPNQEAFGQERLKALVRQIAHLPVAQIISRISQELRAWMRDAPQFDDLTFIVTKIKE
jgi:predicted permease